MHFRRLPRLLVVVVVSSIAVSCDANTSPTAPRAPNVSARFFRDDGAAKGKVRPPPKVAKCSPREENHGTARIGSAGGTLKIGSSTLIIPAGALASSVDITGRVKPGPSQTMEFTPEGLQFAAPVSLTMSFAKCQQLGFGVVIAYVQADTVSEVEPSQVYLLRRTVTAHIRHFSSYAIAY
jgi:hypothetical protein